MSSFDPNAFANASAEDGDFPKAPEPGTYTVVLEATKAYTNKKGNDVIRLDFRVVTGEYGNAQAGHTWAEFLNFKTEGAYNFAKGQCEKLGMTVDGVSSLADFGSRLEPLYGRWYRMDVEQNGEYRNAYVREEVDEGAPALAASDVPAPTSDFQPVATPADDDIPF